MNVMVHESEQAWRDVLAIREWKRTRIYVFDPEWCLPGNMKLPLGCEIRGVTYRDGKVKIKLWHPSYDAVPEGEAAPEVYVVPGCLRYYQPMALCHPEHPVFEERDNDTLCETCWRSYVEEMEGISSRLDEMEAKDIQWHASQPSLAKDEPDSVS